jgi:hypothetical protein
LTRSDGFSLLAPDMLYNVNWFNDAKGFGFITPSDGGKDSSFISPRSTAAASRR